jgi:hypothetical protein
MNAQIGALVRLSPTIVIAFAMTACAPLLQRQSSHPPDLWGGIPIYMSADQVPHSFNVVSPVSYYNLGKFHIMSIDDSFADLRQQASAVGANAVLIDDSEVIVSESFPAGYRFRDALSSRVAPGNRTLQPSWASAASMTRIPLR